LGQVPIATTCCIIMTRDLRNFLSEADRHKNSQMEEPQDERQKRLLSFDYPGAVTLAIWITSFLVIIDLQVQLSWTHPLLLSLVIIGIMSFLVFLLLETYPGSRELLIPLSLLKTEVGAFCVGQVSDTILQSFLRCKKLPRNIIAAMLRINANSMFNVSYFWSAVVKEYVLCLHTVVALLMSFYSLSPKSYLTSSTLEDLQMQKQDG